MLQKCFRNASENASENASFELITGWGAFRPIWGWGIQWWGQKWSKMNILEWYLGTGKPWDKIFKPTTVLCLDTSAVSPLFVKRAFKKVKTTHRGFTNLMCFLYPTKGTSKQSLGECQGMRLSKIEFRRQFYWHFSYTLGEVGTLECRSAG